MVNYQNGKIYTIRSRSREDLVYVGSTCNSLAKRLGGHRSKYRNNRQHNMSSFQVLDIGDEYIELLELYPCSNNMELERREGQLIRSMNCVNKRVERRTAAEYYQDKKESIKARTNQYYQDNKEACKAQRKQYHQDNKESCNSYTRNYRQANKEALKAKRTQRIPCSYCNQTFSRGGKVRHIKSQTHQANYKKAFKENFGIEFEGTIPFNDF